MREVVMRQNQAGQKHEKNEPLQESDARHSAMIANIGDVIGIIGADGIMKYISPNIERWFGWKPEDLVGTDGWELAHPEDIERLQKEFYEGIEKDNASATIECRYKCKDGTYKWIELIAVNRINDTAINGVLLNYHDITERKQAEENLRKSEEKYRALFEKAGNAIFIHDLETMLILDANSAMSATYGYRYDELVGMNCLDLSAEVEKSIKASSSTDEDGRFSVTLRWHKKKDGTVFPIELDGYSIALNEKVVGCSVIKDITERKRAEDALWNSENRFKTAFYTSPDAVNINRLEDGLYIDINEGFTLLTGYTREDVIGKTSVEINIWHNPADRQELVRGLKEKGHYTNLEAKFQRKDGSITTALMSASIIDLEGVAHILSITRDITKRKQVELALAAEKERLAVTLRSIGDGVITTDMNGNIVTINKAAEALTGWNCDEAVGQPLPKVFNIINERTRQQCENPVERVLSAGKIVELANHTSLITKDGREIVIADSGAPIHDNESRIIGVVLVFRDMTEKQKLENFIQKSQKLESLGVLAGGIAHDFNNLLGAIFGYIEMAMAETTEERVSTFLAHSLSSLDRARALTRQLLTFAKGGAPIKKVENLFPFVQETVQFALSGSSVSSRFQIQENLWPCNFDKNQMGQVIDNLTINAQQAMPNGGTIEVSARNISLSEKEHISLVAGNYVKLTIKDQGIGIPKNFLPHIFDPYYTTKPKGHGLGLATCYSIVNRHGGYMDIESEPGTGSTFHVYLPASTEPISPMAGKSTGKHTGSGTFLVMDDEEVIREIMRKMLGSFGYTVVLKENGKDAIDFIETEIKADRELAGMIFDLTIPGGMGGKEAIGEIRQICSDTPAFVASGYSNDPIMANPEQYGFTASLCKPFLIAELSEMLEKHLKKHK